MTETEIEERTRKRIETRYMHSDANTQADMIEITGEY